MEIGLGLGDIIYTWVNKLFNFRIWWNIFKMLFCLMKRIHGYGKLASMGISQLERLWGGLMMQFYIPQEWKLYEILLSQENVNILIWCILMDRLPARSNLANRNMDVPSILYSICQLEVKQVDHLFIRCEVTTRTCNDIFSSLNTDSNFDMVYGLFSFFDNDMLNSRKRRVADAIACTTFWYIERFWNNVVFQTGKIRRCVIIDSIKKTFFFVVFK